MKKTILTAITLVVLLGSYGYSASFGGFQTNYNSPTIQELSISGGGLDLATTGIGSIEYSVQCNYDGWSVMAYGDGLANADAGHTIALEVASVAAGAAAPSTYTALGATELASTTISNGNFMASPVAYDLHLKSKASDYANRRAGYHGAYVNIKITPAI